jgi:hypothetical protein
LDTCAGCTTSGGEDGGVVLIIGAPNAGAGVLTIAASDIGAGVSGDDDSGPGFSFAEINFCVICVSKASSIIVLLTV